MECREGHAKPTKGNRLSWYFTAVEVTGLNLSRFTLKDFYRIESYCNFPSARLRAITVCFFFNGLRLTAKIYILHLTKPVPFFYVVWLKVFPAR